MDCRILRSPPTAAAPAPNAAAERHGQQTGKRGGGVRTYWRGLGGEQSARGARDRRPPLSAPIEPETHHAQRGGKPLNPERVPQHLRPLGRSPPRREATATPPTTYRRSGSPIRRGYAEGGAMYRFPPTRSAAGREDLKLRKSTGGLALPLYLSWRTKARRGCRGYAVKTLTGRQDGAQRPIHTTTRRAHRCAENSRRTAAQARG